MEMLKKDIYATSDVWDFNKAGFSICIANSTDFLIDSNLSVQVCFPAPMIESQWHSSGTTLVSSVKAPASFRVGRQLYEPNQNCVRPTIHEIQKDLRYGVN
jgi:hypothetical protein